MSEHLKEAPMSRRQFIQSSVALLFAAQCPVGLSTKALADSGGANGYLGGRGP